jgi:hypothetical protein
MFRMVAQIVIHGLFSFWVFRLDAQLIAQLATLLALKRLGCKQT